MGAGFHECVALVPADEHLQFRRAAHVRFAEESYNEMLRTTAILDKHFRSRNVPLDIVDSVAADGMCVIYSSVEGFQVASSNKKHESCTNLTNFTIPQRDPMSTKYLAIAIGRMGIVSRSSTIFSVAARFRNMVITDPCKQIGGIAMRGRAVVTTDAAIH